MSSRAILSFGALAALTLVSCGNYSGDPNTLLREAKSVLDHTQTVRFHVSSNASSIKAPGAYLLSGDGVARRPDQFSGTVNASIDGLSVPVPILSIDGKFYVQTPIIQHWQQAKPGDYGFSDPATLISPDHGLSTFLVGDPDVKLLDNYRSNGEDLAAVSASVSGTKIVALIESVDQSRNVTVKFGINTATNQLREIIIDGLYIKGVSTPVDYTVTLTDYGTSVSITPPA